MFWPSWRPTIEAVQRTVVCRLKPTAAQTQALAVVTGDGPLSQRHPGSQDRRVRQKARLKPAIHNAGWHEQLLLLQY